MDERFFNGGGGIGSTCDCIGGWINMSFCFGESLSSGWMKKKF
jgi:hypothetical protein